MKVLLVNGSPHKNGCTNVALEEVKTTLENEGIEADIFWVGTKPISGCLGCGRCNELKKCVIEDKVNECLCLIDNYEGFIFGTPVHWAAASGAITSFMDRLFYAANRKGGDSFYLKPAACVISARRAGTTATFDQMNKYFTLMQMPVISSQYWNMVHGSKPEDVKEDTEGLQTMRTLARNMVYFLKCKQAGQDAGIPLPQREQHIYTNFIR